MRVTRALLLALAACGPAKSATTATAATTATDGSTTGASTTTTTDSPTSHSVVDTTSTGSSDTGPSTPTETSHAFIMDPDPPACDLFAQDCPPGEKCSFFSEDIHRSPPIEKCVPVAPNPRQPDELCHFNEPGMGLDDCAPGSYCLPYSSDGAGASSCVALCAAETYTCADDEHLCILLNEGTFWCNFNCHPLLQDCAEALACSILECLPASPGFFDRLPGAPCSSAECVPKSICVPAELVPGCDDELCCTELCDLEAPAPCALPGQSCQLPPEDWNPILPADVGLCMLP